MLLLTLLLAAAPAPLKPLPVLAKEPKIDGDLKDLAPATDFKMPEGAKGASAALAVKASFKKDTLYVGVTVTDDKVLPEDRLDVTLFFPEAGTTAKGVVFRLGSEGLREPPEDVGAPTWAQALVKAGTKSDAKGFTVELAVPARALPRFQAFKPLALTVCAEYADADGAGEPVLASTCPSGDMPGGPTRLPDELRKNLKLTPAPDVEGIEAREHGWVGYSKLHYASWAEGDSEITPALLAELILGDTAIEPRSVALPIPAQLVLPDNRPIYTVLSGRNPYVGKEGTCLNGAELRMAMYVVKGTNAARVLEWPAANCKLGRAMQFELNAEGNLTIGYTNGNTAHFAWSGDHFERSELGLAR